ncbi:MAG: DUF1836 domain-containing protein [Defluviitaleaceae bacterium]|nr:DUF1836 domain-containing protein [Defluviitaleaceae bacterium]
MAAQVDPLKDIKNYAPTMTISQVLKFCEKKGLNITRGMIQNYIRDGLLPPGVGKRKYTHNHIAALVLIDRLKVVFDMQRIQAVLTPVMNETGVPIEEYESLMARLEGLNSAWCAAVEPSLNHEADALPKMLLAAKAREWAL